MSDLMEALERSQHQTFIQELQGQWYVVIGGIGGTIGRFTHES